MEGDFFKVSFLEQVGTSETFAVVSGLEVISRLPVVKEVIVFTLHIVSITFCSFTMAFQSLNPHVTEVYGVTPTTLTLGQKPITRVRSNSLCEIRIKENVFPTFIVSYFKF